MSIASLTVALVSRRSAKRFERASQNPLRTQKDQLLALVEKNAGTEYGRRHGFESIRTIADYQKQVPVVNYETISEDMKRVLSGARNVFTAEDPLMFARTSGTSGDPKYIPVTPSCQGQAHKDVMRTWLYHAREAHPDLFAGKIVTLVSRAVEGHVPSGVPYGSTSGHMYRHMPKLVKRAYAIPYEVFEIRDYTAKYYVIMRIAVESDVRFLATANPSSILKLCEKADEFSETMIRDVRDGSLSRDFSIEPEVREHLKRLFRPNSELARRLNSARQKRGGVLKPADYWPKLSLIGCWKGGTVGRYLGKFPEWFDPDGDRPVAVRDWGYLSSEARGSVPLSDEGSQGVLTIGSNFFEFVEADELEDRRDDLAGCTFLTVEKLEEGKDYYIFLTTSGGLYRYDINDVVRVTGYYNATPQIEFLRKGRGMTNLTGEKVSVNQVMDAVEATAEATGLLPDHFRAVADPEQNRYLLRVEFSSPPSSEAAKDFLAEFDRQLKRLNGEYQEKRDSLRLGPPVLHIMREGWYEEAREHRIEDGMRAFQIKTQLLVTRKKNAEEVPPEVEKIVELEES